MRSKRAKEGKERLWALNDEQWSQVENLFPHPQGRKGFPQKISNRTALEAVLYRDRTGIPWRDLPMEYGPWHTIYMRWYRWVEDGVLEYALAVLKELAQVPEEVVCIDSTVVRAHQHAAGARKSRGPQALGRSRGGLSTKIHVAGLDSTHAAVVTVTAGQEGDAPVGEAILETLETLEGMRICIGDRAYDSDAIRDLLQKSGRKAVIPPRANRHAPIPFDAETYKQRNQVERLFNHLKQFRSAATRYDKLSAMFLGMITAALFVIGLK